MQIVNRIYRKRIVECVVVSSNETHEIIERVCDKCGGTGRLKHYAHVDNGVCFKCGGNGKTGKQLKIKRLSEEELEQAIKQIEEEERIKLEEHQKAWREQAKEHSYNYCKNEIGVFRNVDTAYIVMEKDTYSIKDELKEMGAKWANKVKRWYFEQKPETDYKLKEVKLENCIYFSDNPNPDIINTWSIAWGDTYKEFEIYQD